MFNSKLEYLKLVFYVSLFCFNRLMSPLRKDEARRNSSLAFIIQGVPQKSLFFIFL